MIRLKRLYAHNFKQLREIELRFPDSARILVQGKNEAGKSTLFEAVFFALFGGGLATEAGGRGLDGLIAYDTEKARVELDLTCDGRLFKIARTIVRGKANLWELDFYRDGQPSEEIRGNAAINKRLVGELGFDGEALLNTCFVEQKKLEKLEGLSKAKREESLAKLLNLDRLVDLENGLKVRAEDKQELERLAKRAELAVAQNELPMRESELATVEQKLQLIDLRRVVEGAAEEMRVLQKLEAEICARVEQRDAAVRRAERILALREAMNGIKEARDAAERAAENARELTVLRTRQAEAHEGARHITELEVRARDLHRLDLLVRRLAQVRRVQTAASERAAQLDSARARLADLSETVGREERLLTRAHEQLVRYEQGETLGEWIAAQQAIVTQDEINRPVQEKQRVRHELSRRFRVELYGLAAILLIFLGASAVLQRLLIELALLAVAAMVLLAIRITLLWREMARAAEALGQAQGQAQAQSAANEAQKERRRQVETRLSVWNWAPPDSVAVAQSQRVAIVQDLDNKTREELLQDQVATRERLLKARAVLGELQRQHALGDASTASVQGELDRCRATAGRAIALLGRWEPRVQTLAESLGVASDSNEIQRALFKGAAQIDEWSRRAREAAAIDQEIARREQVHADLSGRGREAFERACVLVKKDEESWRPSLSVEDYTAFGKQLRAEHDGLGGEAAVKQARELEGELGRRQGERDSRARNAAALVVRARELLAGLGQPDGLPPSPTPDQVEELSRRFRSVDLGNESELQVQERQLLGRLHSLRDRQAQLERELGLTGERLDSAACRTEFDEKTRAVRVRERSVEILSAARRRIVQKVLPATMDYMRQILPTLTQDRYHDAQLDDETYKIQVWDERAGQGGAFKEKNIFSGGTKDQFSLALRLAFALATLPQGRGTAPSFIFLDEPLSSFDQERAEALIYLLTEGEIARAFDQIFLISHVHVDERLFTHRVVLENGRVAYSDLPEEEGRSQT